MKQSSRTQVFLIIILSVASVGLMIESIIMRWEFWMPPLILIGVVLLWAVHTVQYGSERQREAFYLAFAMFAAFFHGVHSSSFFDVVVISMLLLITFSILNRTVFLNLLFIEYIIILLIQIALEARYREFELDDLNISRMIMHIAVEICVFIVCRHIIFENSAYERKIQSEEDQMKENARDMDDFLSNVSHELRTPVNVVNGMSALVLKNNASNEINAIRDAGIKLSRQIEDIQDYTEIMRGDILLENENYMVVSLINDIIAGLQLKERRYELEFVVDISPDIPSLMRGDVKKLSKIIKSLLNNAMKFTRKGGIYLKLFTVKKEYGVNLEIEVTDTGIGMTRKDIANVSKGFYQADKRRDRSSGGIGLGLSIVYGFVHKMEGFVVIDSTKGKGTTIKLSIPQEVVDEAPCMRVEQALVKNILFYVKPEKYGIPEVRDFYSSMAANLAAGLKINLYSVSNTKEIEAAMEELEISHIFMGAGEYLEDTEYFDSLAEKDIVVTIYEDTDFKKKRTSRVIVMPKPLYGYSVTRVLNEGAGADNLELAADEKKPDFDGIKALIVDDEPMNLVVATGLFNDYGMITDTAESGKKAIEKYNLGDYDIIFMDHMMPEMDGVEAMHHIRRLSEETDKKVRIVALTANAVSGAREMFLREGFDGFISKPIDIGEFERAMKKLFAGDV